MRRLARVDIGWFPMRLSPCVWPPVFSSISIVISYLKHEIESTLTWDTVDVSVTMLPSTSLLLVICAFSTTLAIPNYSCKIYLATTPISTQNVHLSITPPANQSAMTAFITSYTSQTSKYFMTSDTNLNGGPHSIDVNDRYQIYTQLCTPSTFENGTDVEFVVHGCVTHGGLKKTKY